MPTLTVKLDNDTLKLADNTVKMDPDNNEVRLANPPLFSSPAITGSGNNNDPAIKTSVTVFKEVSYGDGNIWTGWEFPNGAAKIPNRQFCYYKQSLGDGNAASQTIGWDGAIAPAPSGVKDQRERFAKCQWFNGHLG